MAQNWQRELAEAQGSTRCTTSNKREVFRTVPFGRFGLSYQIRCVARWDDVTGNGSNSFYYAEDVVAEHHTIPSERLSVYDAPAEIIDSIPKHIRDLKKWNGCHPFGPWYYMENGLYFANDKDHYGLRAGERRQMYTNADLPMWSLMAVDESPIVASRDPIPLYKLPTLLTGDKPKDTYRLVWVPCMREGEGKQRELDAFRRTCIWPEATMADIEREDLSEVLKARLPGLLREFRAAIEGLGFTW